LSYVGAGGPEATSHDIVAWGFEGLRSRLSSRMAATPRPPDCHTIRRMADGSCSTRMGALS